MQNLIRLKRRKWNFNILAAESDFFLNGNLVSLQIRSPSSELFTLICNDIGMVQVENEFIICLTCIFDRLSRPEVDHRSQTFARFGIFQVCQQTMCRRHRVFLLVLNDQKSKYKLYIPKRMIPQSNGRMNDVM